MSGYLGTLKYTGVPEVDALLSVLEDSGDRYHHTDQWNEKDDGESCVDRINFAAMMLAMKIKLLQEPSK